MRGPGAGRLDCAARLRALSPGNVEPAADLNPQTYQCAHCCGNPAPHGSNRCNRNLRRRQAAAATSRPAASRPARTPAATRRVSATIRPIEPPRRFPWPRRNPRPGPRLIERDVARLRRSWSRGNRADRRNRPAFEALRRTRACRCALPSMPRAVFMRRTPLIRRRPDPFNAPGNVQGPAQQELTPTGQDPIEHEPAARLGNLHASLHEPENLPGGNLIVATFQHQNGVIAGLTWQPPIQIQRHEYSCCPDETPCNDERARSEILDQRRFRGARDSASGSRQERSNSQQSHARPHPST